MTFQSVLTEAVADVTEHGYDVDRLEGWIQKLRHAADLELATPAEVDARLNAAFGAIYRRMVEKGGVLKFNPGVSQYQVSRLTPDMRRELDKRIVASANLIKLNRQKSIAQTLDRFSGWTTSISTGGSRNVDKRKVKSHIGKSLRQSSYEERRVIIDQGHKLISSINEVVANGSGAIAMQWNSHYRQAGYNYRPDHKELDGKVFAVRGNWAMEKGYMNKGDGYTDEVERPAQAPFCRCFYTAIYALRDLPEDMLTASGKKILAETKIAV